MKKYRVNDKVVAVRENSLAHKFIEYGTPVAVIGGAFFVIAIIYGITIMWADILG